MTEKLKKDLLEVLRSFLFEKADAKTRNSMQHAMEQVLRNHGIRAEESNVIIEQYGVDITAVLYLEIAGVRRCFECFSTSKFIDFTEVKSWKRMMRVLLRRIIQGER